MSGRRTGSAGTSTGMARMRGAVVAVLAVAALGLAGCDGSDEVAGDAAPVQVSSSPAVPGTPTGTPAASPASTGPSALAGENTGYVRAVDPGARTVTVDVVEWFTGAAAKKACAEDGVGGSGAWCVQYYFRNRNPLQRTLPVAPDARVEVLTGAQPTPGTLGRVTVGDLYRFDVTAGRVTALTAVYTP